MLSQVFKFGVVGGLATFIYMLIGFSSIQSGWQPLVADIVAYVVAFTLGFVGHLWFSFADQDLKTSSALSKFAIAASIGFCHNETMLAALLSFGALPATVALWITTGTAAVSTFVLSKVWAFRKPGIVTQKISSCSI